MAVEFPLRTTVVSMITVASMASAVFVWQRVPEQVELVNPSVVAVWEPLKASTERLEFRLDAAVQEGMPSVVRSAGGPTGQVVTRSPVTVGAEVHSGDEIARVGKTPVVAVHTPEPFFRSLVKGDRGPDVTMLQNLLVAARFLGPTVVKGTFDARTERAVTAWNLATFGEKRPSFDRSSVVWLPTPSIVAAKVDLAVGTLWPADGLPLITSAAPIASLRVKRAPSGATATAVEIGIPHGSEVTWLAPARTDSDRLVLDGPFPPALTAAIHARTTDGALVVQARSAQTREVYRVPTSAVVVSDDGTTCALVKGQDGVPREMAVDTVQSTPGFLWLSRESLPGEHYELAVNHAAMVLADNEVPRC